MFAENRLKIGLCFYEVIDGMKGNRFDSRITEAHDGMLLNTTEMIKPE